MSLYVDHAYWGSICVQTSDVNMASQEEDNKLEYISNVNKEQEIYYLNVYKKYESILNDKSEKFEHKVQSLIEVWKSIAELNFSLFDIKYIIQIIDWAKLHALNIVLTGEWRSTKESFRDSLLECIEKAQESLASVNNAFSTRCQKLADVVKKPWEDPVLYNLIQERDAEIGSKEIEFFCVETAYLVSVRLKKLCENHCEDLALNLVTNFLKYKKQATVQNFNLNATETQLWFIFDIYIALLYKFQDKTKILEQFQELQILEGVQLIKRFAKKRVKISKIWRNCHKIAIFGSRFFLSKALIKYNDNLKESLTDLLKTYLTLSNTDALLQEFVVSVRNLTNLADAEGLCIMCEVIHKEAADKLRHFAIEMYIRALTTDMNELERLKHVNEDEKVKLTTSRLALTFSNLAKLLDDHVKVARECVLTAFSLEPTKERLTQIEELARRSGFPVLDTGMWQEWKCRLHPPVLPSDDVAWVCPECGEWMCKPELTAPLQMNTPLQEALQESVLGISEALCDDLVVCLSNPRYQILSWLLSWGDLYRLCILYLNDPEKTKNFVTELKFIDVDYSMFEHIKREPVDEYTGIEKGYEQYLDLDFVSDEETSSVSEDSMTHDRSVGLGSDGTGESCLPLPQPKSDPNTLKSLRMFRPSLKRKKDDSELPTKEKKLALHTNNNLSSSSRESGSINYSDAYLSEIAGVTKNHPNSILNPLSNAGNFSISEKPANSESCLVNTKTVSSALAYEAPRSQSLSASVISQPVNSVFDTTNLSSVTSTSYVSNIIKSSLTFGVPKVTPPTTSLQPSVNIQNYNSNHINKASGTINSRQGTFATPNTASKRSTSYCSTKQSSTFVSANTITQKGFKPIHKSHQSEIRAASQICTVKNSTRQMSSSVANDLDALLKEVVNDIDADSNKTHTSESKNGIAATLPQLGGQVANNHRQLIQVSPQQSCSLSLIQTKLPPETSSLSGTTDVYKTKLRSSNKQDKHSHSGDIINPRKRKQSEESSKITTSLGKDIFKIKDLRVKIPRLNLEKYNVNQDQDKPVGKKLEKKTETIISQETLIKQFKFRQPVIHLKDVLSPSVAPVIKQKLFQTQPKVTEQPTVPTEIQTPQKSPEKRKTPTTVSSQHQPKVPQPLDTVMVQQSLKQELLTHHQAKSQSPTEVPVAVAPAVPLTQTVCPQKSPISPCQEEQCSLRQESIQAESPSRETPLHQVVNIQKSPPAQLRLDKVLIVSQEKMKEILSQASYREGVYKTTITPLELHGLRLTPKKTSTGTSKIVQDECSPLPNQTKKVSTCLDSIPNQAMVTVNCDKDKLQNGNKKTDVHSTEIAPDAFKHLQKTEQPGSSIENKFSSLDEDETNSRVIKQIADKLEKSSTHNMSDSIKTVNDTASDKIVVSNEQIMSDNQTKVLTENSVNGLGNCSTTKETIENVNKILDCDIKIGTDLHIDNGPKQPVNCDNDETLARIEEWLENAVNWNTKDTQEIRREKTCNEPKLDCSSISIVSNKSSDITQTENDGATHEKSTDQTSILDLLSESSKDDVSTTKTCEDSRSIKGDDNTERQVEDKYLDDCEQAYIALDSISVETNTITHFPDDVINETIVDCSNGITDPEDVIEETIPLDIIESEVTEISTKSAVTEVVVQDQKVIKTAVVEARSSDKEAKQPVRYEGCRSSRNDDNELRITVEKQNVVDYMHDYCQRTPYGEYRLILKDPVQAIRERFKRAAMKEAIKAGQCPFTDIYSSGVNKENIKDAYGRTLPGVSTPTLPRNYLLDSFYQIAAKFFEGPLDFTFMNCPPERLKSFGYGGRRPKHSGLKIYSNSRKRRHDDVPCFKLDQEKDAYKPRNRRLTVALKRLPEVIGRPNVTVLVTDPFKNDEERIDGDIYKKTTPLVDCNVRNEVKIKMDSKNYSKKYINKNKIKKDYPEGESYLGKNYGVHVNIYEDKFYSMIAKVDRPLGRCGINGPVEFSIPGLHDYSEILPRNVNHVVNVVQHTVPRSSTVNNQNTQTSTQVTPHIQRIGQPKLPDRKPDLYEDDTEQLPSSSTVLNEPSTSQSSAAKPGQKSVQSRQAPNINILSQQILRPTTYPLDMPTATVIKVEPDDHAEVQATKTVNTNVRIVTTTTQAGGATATTSTPTQGGTILQFICKSSSLPKFQQAFGKTVYQTGTCSEATSESSGASAIEHSNLLQTATLLEAKKIATKALPVNVQPFTGNVIFRGQVPVGQTVSLIPPGSNTRQLFRITGSTHEQISLVKETVIQNKMSALLAAALQGKPKITEQNGELVEEYSATRITLCRPGTVPPNATRIVKPVHLQIPANVIRAPQPNVSSTTLEQLREFDMVYKQVKERSGNPTQPENSAQSSQEAPQQQRISFTYVNQVQKYTQLSPVVVVSSYSPIQQTVSPALTVTSQGGSGSCQTQVSTVTIPKVAVKSSKGKSIKSSVAKTSPTTVTAIPKPQQKPQEDEHTTQRIFDILAEYAEQLRNSPDLNNKPAPRRRSNPPTNPSSTTSTSSSSKKKKKKSSSSTTSNLVETDNEDLTMGSEDSSGGNVVQLSMTDEEQSQSASITPPESNLEPATSNTTPTPRPLIVTDTSNQPRNVIIADSSVGEALKMPNTALLMPGNYIMPVSVVKGAQQIAVVSGGSKILTTVPARTGQNMLLFQSFVNQNKKCGISAVKYSTLQPFTGISSQNVAGVNAQSPVVLPSNSVATVALGQPITLKKIEDNERSSNTELLLTISQPRDSIKMEKSPDIPQPDSSTNLSCETIEVKIEDGNASDPSSNKIFNNIQKTNSVATSVIASVIKKEEEGAETGSSDISAVKVEEPPKPTERIGSVLVNASTSNGPMLSHTNARYRKPAEGVESTTASVKEFSHNPGKGPQASTKIFKNNTVYYAIRTKKAINKKIDSEMQKQAAMERELRLQKTLSEECEDLGVDEPSTSDLFPEADLLFDSNHSPSYDQSGQKIQGTEAKAKDSLHLFSDDENSEPLRTDLFDFVEYHPPEPGVDQINGNNGSNESASSCDDSTLLPNCSTMSEVTLNSPISPGYSDNSHAIKYKYKYTNRKKGEKVIKAQSENLQEVTEVTSSEDTTELVKEREAPITIQEETVIDGAMTKVDTVVMDHPEADSAVRCPIHNSGDSRVSRKTTKRTCSCFNGSRSLNVSSAKKRVHSPKSQGPAVGKKLLLSKKR